MDHDKAQRVRKKTRFSRFSYKIIYIELPNLKEIILGGTVPS